MGQELEPHKHADKGLGEGGRGGQTNQVLAFCMSLERVREKGNTKEIISRHSPYVGKVRGLVSHRPASSVQPRGSLPLPDKLANRATIGPGMVAHGFDQSIQETEVGRSFKFKASLIYIMNSKTDRYI